jgi:hypothetical protein
MLNFEKLSKVITLSSSKCFLCNKTSFKTFSIPITSDTSNLFKKDFPFLWSGHLSIICYLNKDYEGGTLYFPEQDVKIVPEPGMFICFPGNLHFIHGVTKTHGATRYTISLWTRFVDFENKLIEE